MKCLLSCKKFFRSGLIPLLALALSSCVTTSQTTTEVDEEDLYEWDGDDLEGKVSIEISLEEQKAYITIGGEEAGWTYVATGTRRYPTPTGTFKVIEKTENKRSNRYGVIYDADGEVVNRDAKSTHDKVPAGGNFEGASMPYWMRLTNYGVGMHAGYIPNPGHPASHGCIRMPEEMAEILFEIVKIGTPVKITREAP